MHPTSPLHGCSECGSGPVHTNSRSISNKLCSHFAVSVRKGVCLLACKSSGESSQAAPLRVCESSKIVLFMLVGIVSLTLMGKLSCSKSIEFELISPKISPGLLQSGFKFCLVGQLMGSSQSQKLEGSGCMFQVQVQLARKIGIGFWCHLFQGES